LCVPGTTVSLNSSDIPLAAPMQTSRSGAKTGPNTTRTPNAGSTNAGSENRQGLTQRARRYDRSERDHGQGTNSTINRKRTDESNRTRNRSADKRFSKRSTNRSAWTQQSPAEWTNKQTGDIRTETKKNRRTEWQTRGPQTVR
jgi:hypothetical protein